MLKEINIVKIQEAIRDVEINRAYYEQAKIKSAAAWHFYQNFVDEDPCFEDANAPEEEIEDHCIRCNEFLALAYKYEEDMYLAHHDVDAAKNRLLALYDEEEKSK
jgi:hypothetical protein